MKERGILFSAPMVRAILAGQKTQTRRVVKGKSANTEGDIATVAYDADGPCLDDAAKFGFLTAGDMGYEMVRCPYGQPGDRLWVRETWGIHECADAMYQRDRCGVGLGLLHYRADEGLHPVPRWRPSIHMPWWASRITLEVTGVRVERVRAISMADVLAEGCILSTSKTEPLDYQNLWESINAKRGFGWDKNPYVWVIQFRRLS